MKLSLTDPLPSTATIKADLRLTGRKSMHVAMDPTEGIIGVYKRLVDATNALFARGHPSITLELNGKSYKITPEVTNG